MRTVHDTAVAARIGSYSDALEVAARIETEAWAARPSDGSGHDVA